MPAIAFESVDVVFGPSPSRALELLDQGQGRDEIFAATNNLVAVHDASLTVDEGEICVLMGLSGSGKSSLLRCVNGLNEISRGKVMVHDEECKVDVAHCARDRLRRLRRNRVSMVFQQFALLPWRTVAENIGFGLELRGASKAERAEVVADKLEMVGLAQWKDKYAHELSGGMQQRVGLARALATDANVLLMDEPFSALDPLIREHLQNELLELQRSLKKSILFVSHDLDEALKLGNHIAIMEAGRIVQFGTPEDIVTRPVNDYVRQFVAHMNPLNVLRAASLMSRIEQLEQHNGELLLDWTGQTRITLDADHTPLTASIEHKPARMVPYDSSLDLAKLGESCDAIVTAGPDMLMRTLIEIRHATGRPVALMESGRMVGVIGDDEIYRGMLHQTDIASQPATAN